MWHRVVWYSLPTFRWNAMKMEAAGSFDMSTNFYQTTQCHRTEDDNFHKHLLVGWNEWRQGPILRSQSMTTCDAFRSMRPQQKNLGLCCLFVLRYGVQVYDFLWYYAAYSGNFLRTFGDNLLVPIFKGQEIKYPRLSNKSCTEKKTYFIPTGLFPQDLWVSKSFNKSGFILCHLTAGKPQDWH